MAYRIKMKGQNQYYTGQNWSDKVDEAKSYPDHESAQRIVQQYAMPAAVEAITRNEEVAEPQTEGNDDESDGEAEPI